MSAQEATCGREVAVSGARIAGIVSCVPARETDNGYFVERFGQDAVNDVVKMIGVEKRRWADAHVTTRDLCRVAGQRLLAGLDWDPAGIDALIVVTQTPDFRLPATACALQAELGLSTSCIAFDVNLGCSGYPYALWLGMTMIQSGAARRVLLAVGDTVSRIVDPQDRATAMLFGDAGTMTALEASDDSGKAHFVLGTDGRGATNLIVPEGAYRQGAAADPRLKERNPACLFMDGGEIFNFTLRAVPPLVARTLALSGVPAEGHDAFLFHQANRFMLNHLAKKAKLPADRVPINIDKFGNTSSASIPLLLTDAMRGRLLERGARVAMFGFGVGYSWGAASLDIGPLQIIETIHHE
jgi:3-oxoacyl-[acyl-carrier-protein] synthase-3